LSRGRSGSFRWCPRCAGTRSQGNMHKSTRPERPPRFLDRTGIPVRGCQRTRSTTRTGSRNQSSSPRLRAARGLKAEQKGKRASAREKDEVGGLGVWSRKAYLLPPRRQEWGRGAPARGGGTWRRLALQASLVRLVAARLPRWTPPPPTELSTLVVLGGCLFQEYDFTRESSEKSGLGEEKKPCRARDRSIATEEERHGKGGG